MSSKEAYNNVEERVTYTNLMSHNGGFAAMFWQNEKAPSKNAAEHSCRDHETWSTTAEDSSNEVESRSVQQLETDEREIEGQKERKEKDKMRKDKKPLKRRMGDGKRRQGDGRNERD